MNRAASLFASLVTAAALVGMPAAASAAQPELVSSRLFDVVVSPGPTLEISFVLTLSDVSTYPVTITAIAGSLEEELWSGTLTEGSYRLRAPLTKITSGPVRVVFRVKMTNLMAARKPTKPEEGKPPANQESGGNQSYYAYRRWEGMIGTR